MQKPITAVMNESMANHVEDSLCRAYQVTTQPERGICKSVIITIICHIVRCFSNIIKINSGIPQLKLS